VLTDSASIEFFGNCMTMGLAFSAVAVVSETIKAVKNSVEDRAAFEGVIACSFLTIVASAIPSGSFLFGALLTTVQFYFHVKKRLLVIRFRRITFALLFTAIAAMVALLINIQVGSALVYKVSLFSLLIVTSFRLYLFSVFLFDKD
jgi:hypothetical protein